MRALLLIFGLLTLLASGCSSSGCYDNRSALPLARFLDANTGKAITLSGVEISGVDAPNNSPIVEAIKSVNQVYLPMRSTENSTAWCFHYEQEGINSPEYNDTITFNYTSRPFFVSEECGAMYEYVITSYSYTKHLIDSVAVTDSMITNVDKPRIDIYFRTNNSDNTEIPDDDTTL